MPLKLKRVYEAPDPGDGKRILVDRLWPRGLAKKDACLDFWMKEIAPSAKLRKWFAHRPDRWERFAACYKAELRLSAAVDRVRAMSSNETVSLLYAAHDREHNHALVLMQVLSPEA